MSYSPGYPNLSLFSYISRRILTYQYLSVMWSNNKRIGGSRSKCKLPIECCPCIGVQCRLNFAVAWSSNPLDLCSGLEFQPIEFRSGLEFQPIWISQWFGVPTHLNFTVAWSSNPFEFRHPSTYPTLHLVQNHPASTAPRTGCNNSNALSRTQSSSSYRSQAAPTSQSLPAAISTNTLWLT